MFYFQRLLRLAVQFLHVDGGEFPIGSHLRIPVEFALRLRLQLSHGCEEFPILHECERFLERLARSFGNRRGLLACAKIEMLLSRAGRRSRFVNFRTNWLLQLEM